MGCSWPDNPLLAALVPRVERCGISPPQPADADEAIANPNPERSDPAIEKRSPRALDWLKRFAWLASVRATPRG